MARPAIWRMLERVANLVGVAAALGALGLIGYFASLGLALVRQGG
jgi:hypothetical protein